MIWRAATLDGRTLVVSADRHFDANEIALRYLQVVDRGDLSLAPASPDEQPQIDVRWVGSDAGEHPNRRRELRQWLGMEWGPWRDERDFVLGERL